MNFPELETVSKMSAALLITVYSNDQQFTTWKLFKI